MGNTLKVKLGLIIFSLLLLVLIPILERNFYAPVTYKKWQQLTWDDFQGFAKPFTGWGAGISSTVIVEWDSVMEKYVAFAVQNNQRSWRRKKLNDPDYGLNHEQYHFNITEIHARIMNHYLDSIQMEGDTNYHERLLELKFELRKMQNAYDDESDHSLILGMQRRWEYKIDSMLLHLSEENGTVKDYFSGAEVFFPSQPKLVRKGKLGYHASRAYHLNDYGMGLTLYSSRFDEREKLRLNSEVEQFYTGNELEIISMKTVDGVYDFEVLVNAKDTTNTMICARWIYHNSILYRLSAEFSTREDLESSGFTRIKESFFDSFRLIDTEEYWFSKYGFESGNQRQFSAEKTEETVCVVYTTTTHYGFYSGPYLREGVGLLIASDHGGYKDEILSSLLLINNNAYLARQTEEGILYFIPSNHLPNKSFRVDFGFFLKEDSVTVCPPFHSQARWIERDMK